MRPFAVSETFKPVMEAIVARIQSSNLEQFRRSRLAYPTIEIRDRIYVEFERAGSHATLEVCAESDWQAEKMLDAAGNVFRSYRLSFRINWPSHGATGVASALARIALFQEVSMLAAEFEAAYAGELLWRMTKTAEEVAEQKKAAEAKALEEKIVAIIVANNGGMRVGQTRYVADTELEDGTYFREMNGRRYQLVVNKSEYNGSYVERLPTAAQEASS